MAAESGIDEKVAGKEGVEGTVAEETPEALREQINDLKKKAKAFKIYSEIVSPTLIALSMAAAVGLVIYQGYEKHPNTIYSVSGFYVINGDLDGNKVSDLVLEQNYGSLIPFFGYESSKRRITYVKSDEEWMLNPNPAVDYDCINDKINKYARYVIGNGSVEPSLNPTEIKCIKGSSDSK